MKSEKIKINPKETIYNFIIDRISEEVFDFCIHHVPNDFIIDNDLGSITIKINCIIPEIKNDKS